MVAARRRAALFAKKASIATVQGQMTAREQEMARLHEDEQRIRANLQALRNTAEEKRLIKRYASGLVYASDLRRALAAIEMRLEKRRAGRVWGRQLGLLTLRSGG